MSYATIIFGCFMLITAICYFIVPKKIQWAVLLVASVLFYVMSSGFRIIYLIAATAVVWGAGLLLDKIDGDYKARKKELDRAEKKALKKKTDHTKKVVTAISVILMVSMIFGTKYFNFFGSLVNSLPGPDPIPVLDILMPLGISYYTLMGIGYIVDVNRGTVRAEKNPAMLMLFLCYFPHIIEGPFDRFDALAKQFREPHCIDYDRTRDGCVRFLWGVFKKVVIADRAGLVVNTLFADAGSHGGGVMLAAAVLYTLQIYAEFSGCMDMVCGASHIFGIDIAENFRRPFFSRSINEFWRRWHITLGAWLKDYVFYAVSLSGAFKKLNDVLRKHVSSKYWLNLIPGAYALFFVWFLNGLWHGASVKYIVYGLYYYALMMLGQMVKPATSKVMEAIHLTGKERWYHAFEILRTCTIVCFGMLIFRAESLAQAGTVFVSLFSDFRLNELLNGGLMVTGIAVSDYVVLLAATAVLIAVSVMQERGADIGKNVSQFKIPVRWSIYLILIFSIIILGAYGGNFANTTFIYGEF